MLKNFDYNDIFSFDQVIELFKNISINKYIIKLVEDKQLPYKSIYTLNIVKLEILKTYIKTYLKTRFIQSFKSLISAFILFDRNHSPNNRIIIN